MENKSLIGTIAEVAYTAVLSYRALPHLRDYRTNHLDNAQGQHHQEVTRYYLKSDIPVIS
jgi:hypothetical protein